MTLWIKSIFRMRQCELLFHLICFSVLTSAGKGYSVMICIWSWNPHQRSEFCWPYSSKGRLNLWANYSEPKKQIAKIFFSSRSYKSLKVGPNLAKFYALPILPECPGSQIRHCHSRGWKVCPILPPAENNLFKKTTDNWNVLLHLNKQCSWTFAFYEFAFTIFQSNVKISPFEENIAKIANSFTLRLSCHDLSFSIFRELSSVSVYLLVQYTC